MGDLNCDLLSETISKSKHLVHIYNTYGLTQVIKEATRTTAETSILTYYIVTNKKDNFQLTVVLFLVALVIMTLFILSGMPGFLKLKRIQKIVTAKSTENLNNDIFIKDLNDLPFELIRISTDNRLVKLEIFLS